MNSIEELFVLRFNKLRVTKLGTFWNIVEHKSSDKRNPVLNISIFNYLNMYSKSVKIISK